MANTLQSLFPFSTVSPHSTQVEPCSVEFSAPIQAGHYVFSKATTPAKQFGTLAQGKTGVIAGVMIGANCAPDDFALSVEEPLELQVLNGTSNTPITLTPFKFTQFAHGDNYSAWWNITGSSENRYEDSFKLSIEGRVKQIANMTDNELKLKICFNFWRVDKNFFKEPELWAELLKKIKEKGL